jgi:hypothetical protein
MRSYQDIIRVPLTISQWKAIRLALLDAIRLNRQEGAIQPATELQALLEEIATLTDKPLKQAARAVKRESKSDFRV